MCVDDDPSPRLRLARQHVRILTWKPWDSESTFRNLPHYLNNLPNLVELCFWENFLPEFITLPGLDFETVYPKLKRIHTGSWTLQGLPPKGFDYPFWSTVTHLQIHPQFALHTETSAFTLPLFVSMKSLTHLAIGEPVTYSRIEEGERNVALDTTINRVLACFPPSLQLCLLSIPSDLIGEDTKERFDALKYGRVHPAIIIWSMTTWIEDKDFEYILNINSHSGHSWDVWTGVPDNTVTFWEAGAAMKKQRREAGWGG